MICVKLKRNLQSLFKDLEYLILTDHLQSHEAKNCFLCFKRIERLKTWFRQGESLKKTEKMALTIDLLEFLSFNQSIQGFLFYKNMLTRSFFYSFFLSFVFCLR